MRKLDLTAAQLREAVIECAVLGLASLLTYWLTTGLLTHVAAESRTANLIGGLWAVIATIFVCRVSYEASEKAAASRIVATFISFVICLLYLLFLPFHLWAFAVLIGLSALVAIIIGRRGDAIIAALTTAVVLVVAEASPHDAWKQPILRLGDTIVGVIVGVAAGWLSSRLVSAARRHA
jgi:uncharacterized membrane protein YccC